MNKAAIPRRSGPPIEIVCIKTNNGNRLRQSNRTRNCLPKQTSNRICLHQNNQKFEIVYIETDRGEWAGHVFYEH